MAKRPNIVFILNDHQAYYRWGWDEGIKPMRPSFDKLSEEGVTFNNAYCVTPLCGPTRRSILTGLYPHTHGQTHNETDAPYDHELYLGALHEAGYRNYYFGKWHAGPGIANDHKCEGYSTEGYGNPYISQAYNDYLKRYKLPRAVHHVEQTFVVPDFTKQGHFLNLKEGEDYQSEGPGGSWEHAIGVTTTPKETHESFFIANLACEQLEKLANQNNDTPFHLRVDFWGPHQPHFPTQEFLDMYKDIDIPEYGNFNTKLEGKPEFYFRERNIPIGKDNRIIYPNPLSWDEWQVFVKHCYAHITMVDEAGGMILNKLRELELDENTLIIWTTDHGDALASQGGHFNKGSYMSEEVMRIPLAMSWKGKISQGQVRDEYVGTVDIPLTILDAAGTRFTKNKVHGKSLIPLVTGENLDWRDEVVSETYGHGYGEYINSRMIICGEYKYIATKETIHELYDLKQDPYELVNQVDNSEYSSIKSDLQDRIMKWQNVTEDPVEIF